MLGFGAGISPYTENSPLYNLIMKGKVKDDYTSQLAFLEEYDRAFGIFDHDKDPENDPLSIIGMHPAEDMITGSRIKSLMDELIACRIPELTHTPLLELMSFPRWVLDGLLKAGRSARIKEEIEVDKLLSNTNGS